MLKVVYKNYVILYSRMQTILYQISFLSPQLAMPLFRSAVFIYLADSRFRNSCACSINNDSVSLCTHLTWSTLVVVNTSAAAPRGQLYMDGFDCDSVYYHAFKNTLLQQVGISLVSH